MHNTAPHSSVQDCSAAHDAQLYTGSPHSTPYHRVAHHSLRSVSVMIMAPGKPSNGFLALLHLDRLCTSFFLFVVLQSDTYHTFTAVRFPSKPRCPVTAPTCVTLLCAHSPTCPHRASLHSQNLTPLCACDKCPAGATHTYTPFCVIFGSLILPVADRHMRSNLHLLKDKTSLTVYYSRAEQTPGSPTPC